MDDNNLNRYGTSVPCSIDDARLGFRIGNSRILNFTSVDSPSSSRQDPWRYQYDLANGFMSEDSTGDLLRIKEEFKMQSMRCLSSKPIAQNPDEVSSDPRLHDNKIISNDALVVGQKELKSVSRPYELKKALKEKGIISRYQEAGSVVMDQNGNKLGYDTEVASSTADAKSRGKSYQNFAPGVLRSSSPESNTGGITLREWLKSQSCKVDKLERLLLFRQIVKLVDFAHSQGSALQDLKPSCFTILPSKKIQYTGSLVMREINTIHGDMNKKRSSEQNTFGNHISGGKQQKLSQAVGSLRNQNNRIGKEIQSYMAGPKILHLQKDFGLYRNVSIAQQQQQSNPTTSQLEKKWYTSPEELDEKGCTFSSNIYGLGVLLFEVRRYL